MLLRKSIHISEGHWKILNDFMRAKGLASPSLAIEFLVKQLVQGATANVRNSPH